VRGLARGEGPLQIAKMSVGWGSESRGRKQTVMRKQFEKRVRKKATPRKKEGGNQRGEKEN